MQADQVLVVPTSQASFIERMLGPKAQPPDQSSRHQVIQGPVHRRPRHRLSAPTQAAHQVFGREMALPQIENLLQNGPSARGVPEVSTLQELVEEVLPIHGFSTPLN
jgi:hypothetical protein